MGEKKRNARQAGVQKKKQSIDRVARKRLKAKEGVERADGFGKMERRRWQELGLLRRLRVDQREPFRRLKQRANPFRREANGRDPSYWQIPDKQLLCTWRVFCRCRGYRPG